MFDATEEEEGEDEDTAELDETEEAVVEEDTMPPAAGAATIDETHSRRTALIGDEDEDGDEGDEDMVGSEVDGFMYVMIVGKE